MDRKSTSRKQLVLAQRFGNGMPSAEIGWASPTFLILCPSPQTTPVAVEVHSCLISEGGRRTLLSDGRKWGPKRGEQIHLRFSLHLCSCSLALEADTIQGSEGWCGLLKPELSGGGGGKGIVGILGAFREGGAQKSDPITLFVNPGHPWAVHAWIWPCTAYRKTSGAELWNCGTSHHPGPRLATGCHIHRTDVNSPAKALKTDLSLETQSMEGRQELGAGTRVDWLSAK